MANLRYAQAFVIVCFVSLRSIVYFPTLSLPKKAVPIIMYRSLSEIPYRRPFQLKKILFGLLLLLRDHPWSWVFNPPAHFRDTANDSWLVLVNKLFMNTWLVNGFLRP